MPKMSIKTHYTIVSSQGLDDVQENICGQEQRT